VRAGVIAAGVVALLVLPATASADGQMRAGVGVVDASWHVGASAGQYASSAHPGSGDVDPSVMEVKNAPSYGIQSRLQARAIVVEGSNGKRFAIVKNDLYIPQDLLWRRTAQILESRGSSIGHQNLTMAITHDHSSPYYSSTAWGAWTFQDVFDVRFYEYYAQRMADAVQKAEQDLKPARVGATTLYLDKPHRNSMGPATADDGTPAGYPDSYGDHDLTVVRFDDLATNKPLAFLVNYSLHGEGLEGNDLISADWVGPLQRMVDRAGGAPMVFTQNAVGTSEPERSTYHSIHERLEFSHKQYGQGEYAARLIADKVLEASKQIQDGTPDPAYADRFIPFQSGSDVATEDRWFPGPIAHPYPGVSSCRTDSALAGNPRFPVIGLPDCESPFEFTGIPTPFNPGLSTDDFEKAGIPIPENYSAPAYTGLEEDVSIHLQAYRLGPMLFTMCSCEQWVDQSRNIKSRTDTVPNNEYLGYDYSDGCTRASDGTWSCVDGRGQTLSGISDLNFERMRAQVRNDAAGWNDPSCNEIGCGLQQESEPADPSKIRGNYTHDDTAENAQWGYRMTIPIGMANDYNGYIASYREYQDRDHYRKALTGWGPHSSDYMATRLVEMGRHLHGGPDAPPEPLDAKQQVDLAHNDVRAQALGTIGSTYADQYQSRLPDDPGAGTAVEQPKDIQRFAAAFYSWTGGSNYTDQPDVKVQRLLDGTWTDYADQSGEIPVTVAFPQAENGGPFNYLAGGFPWKWTATFEAFGSRFDTGSGRSTPAGTYRFVVDGLAQKGGAPTPYHLESTPFAVGDWTGIIADDARQESDGRVSFAVGPRHTYEGSEIGPIDYPDSYDSPVRFIHDQRTFVRDPAAPNDPSRYEWYCLDCTFRPWADFGDATDAKVMFVAPNGKVDEVAASEQGGRWVTDEPLRDRSVAVIGADCVHDAFGDRNGGPSAVIGGSLPDGVVAACGQNARPGHGGPGAGGPHAPPAPRAPAPAAVPALSPATAPAARPKAKRHAKRHRRTLKRKHRRR
jgi:hypothetical protein